MLCVKNRVNTKSFQSKLSLIPSLALSLESHLSFSALQGYALFFDEKMSKEESSIWFNKFLPAMACLLLRLPSLSVSLISKTIMALKSLDRAE